MLIDARTLESGSRLEAEVCVVGGGPAGLITAQGLTDSAARVVVLESGGLRADPATHELSRGRVRGQLVGRGGRYLAATRTRALGGLADAWHRSCRPLDAEDFARRAWVPDSGWPLAPQTLQPYYERAQALLRLKTPRTAAPGEMLGDDRRFAGSWLAYTSPAALGPGWRRRCTESANLDVITWANVVSLELDASGTRVERARIRCLDGPSLEVRADHFVLAAGALENARLLLASNAQRPAGLGNGSDLVGRFFMDQLTLEAGFVSLPGSAAVMRVYEEPATAPAQRAITRPTSALQARHELLNALITFAPASDEEGGALTAAVESTTRGLARLAGEGPVDAAYFGAVALRGEQRPLRDSRVTLGESRDALDMPRLDLDWRISDHDTWSLRTTARLLAESLGERRLGRLQLRVAKRLSRRNFGWSGYQSGTTRMSDEPATGVVDPDCRVHDLPNLFVAGSSVFPTSGCSGPMLTIAALALRLADHLRRRLDG